MRFALYTAEVSAMQPVRHRREIFRFGPFEVDVTERILRKHGVRIRLQTQPFLLLAALLERPGNVVIRDDLRRRIWPEDTFVDFEHGLNAAVTRLRRALSDSVAEPRYIETVPKYGYRFCAEVEREAFGKQAPAAPVLASAPHRSLTRWVLPAALCAFLVAFWAVFALHRPVSRSLPSGASPLTSFRGQEIRPALSPDGSQVAFAWNGPQQDNFDICRMRLDSNKPFRVTADPAHDLSPAWSPDGNTIAFIRQLNTSQGELLLVPATGGPEQKIAELTDEEFRESPGRLVSLAWSPDGSAIAASHRQPNDASERIYLFSRSGAMRQLTSPAAPLSDHTPAFSSDGRVLAFTRLTGFSAAEIYKVSIDSGLRVASDARRVSTSDHWCVNPAFVPGKNRILYLETEGRLGHRTVKMTAANSQSTIGLNLMLHEEPLEITVGSQDLIYSTIRRDTNIWKARIPAGGDPPSKPELFISSTRFDGKTRYSPDGSKIAFTSSRSGTQEIWVSAADGSDPLRITNFGGPVVGYASWSPDGQWLTFHARPEGQADLFLMPAAGGPAKRLTSDRADDTMPCFSRDGRSIYFSSARSGQFEIWRMPASGGPAAQITRSGGFRPIESADGQKIFYLTLDASRIRSVPAGGGPASDVTGPMHMYPAGLSVTSEGIYYEAPPHSGDQRYIRFLSFSTQTSRPVAVANRPFDLGLTVSPRERSILFDQVDDLDRDLMLLRNFHPQ